MTLPPPHDMLLAFLYMQTCYSRLHKLANVQFTAATKDGLQALTTEKGIGKGCKEESTG